VGCSFSAGEGLAATAFADELDGEDERSSANGGASKVPPMASGPQRTEAEKYPLWLRLTPEAKNHPFLPDPNMPRF